MKPILSLILIITMAALCIGCGSARSLAIYASELTELLGGGSVAVTLILE